MEAISVSKLEFRKKLVSFGVAVSLTAVSLAVVITACTDHAKALSKIDIIQKDTPPKAGVVAKVGEKELTEADLIGEDNSDFLELEKRKFDLENDRLIKYVEKMVIDEDAKKAGMSPDDFINKKVVGEVSVPDSEYKKFVAEKHIPEAQITPQIKERIIAYIKSSKRQEKITAYVSKHAPKVYRYFAKPKKIVPNLEVGEAPVFGKKDAPVTIIEFSDFQCPFCARAAETVSQVKKKYGNKVRVAFRHFPLPMHKDARPASEASMCVNEQSTDKFWKYHDLLFKNQDKLDKANLEKFAKDVGADVKKFNQCVEAKKFADYVQKDMEYGEKVKVQSTPTFFVNGEQIAGAVPIETFSETIDEHLAEKK